MTDQSNSIKLINSNNITFLKTTDAMYDFIYADPLYENKDIDWVYHAVRHLKDNGILVIQTDYHTVVDYKHFIDRLELQHGNSMQFVNWLIYMNNWGGVPSNRFAQKHDDILVYCKGKNWKWHPERIQIPKATAGTTFDKKGTGTKTPPSVFYDHASFSTMSSERVEIEGSNFYMQKPLWLMERLMLPFTDEGDSVLDMFAGTATLGVVCKKYNRAYTGTEYITSIYEVANKRLTDDSLYV